MFKTHIEEDILEEQVASKLEEVDIVVVLQRGTFGTVQQGKLLWD